MVLLWVVITDRQVFEQWCEMLVSNYICFRYYFIWIWVVITLIILWCLAMYLWTLYNMWHVCWIMYDLGCMLAMNRDPSWYSTDYRVYMGSSMKVLPLRGLPLYLSSYKLDGSVTILKRISLAPTSIWAPIVLKKGNSKIRRYSLMVSMSSTIKSIGMK